MSRFDNFSVLNWTDVREEVNAAEPNLATIIDEIEPSENEKLVKITYSYGDLVVKNGKLQIPCHGTELLSISNHSIPKALRDLLDYQKIPLMLTLKNCNEVFIESSKRIIPLNLFYEGSLLGLFETLDNLYNRQSEPMWSVSAGARTLFMLPKLSNRMGLDRLRVEYNIPHDVHINGLADHWEIFNYIASRQDNQALWSNEIIFFTKNWVDALKKRTKKWMVLKDYLVKNAWEQSQFAIGNIELKLGWEKYAEAISMRKLRPSPYIADQVKHILSIIAGKSPAMYSGPRSQDSEPLILR